MAKISANNLLAGSITSDKLDASVVSGLASANNANAVATIATAVAAAAFASANTNAAILANSASPLITSIQIADSSYNVLDDTAANTTGGFVVITGSGFTNSSTVVFGSTAAPAVSFVDSTTLRAQVPALTAASYPVYVVNSNGGTGIRVNGLTTSSFPAWSTGATLSNQTANTSFAVNLSATSDSNITYANTSALPAGTTLAANGRFSGTVTIGTQTTYTFDVKATDVENQDATRTFSLTVTIILNFLYSTGWNQFGILGQNVSINRSSPVQIGTDAWNTVSSSFTHTLAVAKNNWLWGWGDAGFSQLGAYTTGSQSNPVLISTSSWKTVAAGRRTSAGIRTNGTLWTWGAGSYGRLGSNSENGRNINSGQVGALTNWNFVACHQYGMVATRTDGTLWAWGRNQNGQLGDNSRINRSSPVQIAGSTWLQPTAGQIATVVRTTDGAVWGWGYIQSFGNAAGTSRSSPGQIGAGITWTNVSMHSEGGHLLALDSLNRAWAGGIGNYGATGQNNTTSNQQIGVNQIAGTWLSLSAGAYGGVGVKDNGSLWAWGRNGRGAVGNNAVADVSSPVQIGSSTNWTAAFGGNETIFAIN